MLRRWVQTETRRSHTTIRDTPSGDFKFNRGIRGLLCISVIVMLVTEANAGLCPVGYTYIGGKCYKTKGVDCEVDLKRLGNVAQHPKSLDCTISPSGQGVLFCGNKASNQPPGQVPVLFTGTFGGATPIDPNKVDKHGN